MTESILTNITTAGSVSAGDYALVLLVAIALGLAIAWTFTRDTAHTKGFAVMLALLPAMAATIVLMVSGSLGASVAVAGTFSLVRFRSAPGTAREIGALLLAMTAGLACGMGWPVLAAAFTFTLCALYYVLMRIPFGEPKENPLEKTLHITVPEDLEYANVFTDVFERYTAAHRMTQVKTTNLGSLNRLTYNVTLRRAGEEQPFIDALRCRNGNLEISLAERQTDEDRL